MVYRILLICLVVLTVATGCSDQRVPDPPTARAELTERLFDALNYKRYDEALAIIEKLLALYPDDSELMEMKSRVIVNACVERIQPLINQGNLEEALKIVRQEAKKHLAIRKFYELEAEILKLLNLQKLAENLKNAKTAAELEDALKKIETPAAEYPLAVNLHNDMKARRIHLARIRKAEAAAKAQAEARAKAEAEKARASARAQAQAEARVKAEAAAKDAREKFRQQQEANKKEEFVGPRPKPAAKP